MEGTNNMETQMKSNLNAGQFNLRGKQTKLLSCRCCVVRNLKTEALAKQAKAEVRQAMNDMSYSSTG